MKDKRLSAFYIKLALKSGKVQWVEWSRFLD